MNSKKKVPTGKQIDTILLRFNKNEIRVSLNETKTARKLLKILPVRSRINTWGDEIYFSVPLDLDIENGIEIVDEGTVAFWPPGSAMCVFFGPTPASVTEKPQAASPVSVIGFLTDESDIEFLRNVKDGDTVSVENANN